MALTLVIQYSKRDVDYGAWLPVLKRPFIRLSWSVLAGSLVDQQGTYRVNPLEKKSQSGMFVGVHQAPWQENLDNTANSAVMARFKPSGEVPSCTLSGPC
jgi:hypothetical protein